MRQILAITRKELSSYFGSPMALIFVGVFLAATLFSFFWIDTFFARGIADVRPLFRWMPLLMIFLVAALTMRQWSEEEQRGTLEMLLTLPVRAIDLVIGKFLAVLVMVATALALTIFLPLTVSLLGNLDWGPVIGGYVATLLLAAAYAAIGLFISSRTNNQIVALILTVLVGGVFYLIGTRGVTEFTGNTVGDVLRLLATGSRFESIERGVLDVRDVMYYLSLAALFLSFNVLSIDSKRWSVGAKTLTYRRTAVLGVSLIALNLLVLNIWLSPQTGVRLDLTEQQEFSLSETTTDLVSNLPEPLLIRGYFSERTHPLLAPLVPRIRDTLREYEIASNGQIQVEIIDPATNPELEAEANQSYGIRPSPFQVAGRYESAVVNAYFDILIRYGDQNEVLSFGDLIEVEPFRDGQVDVRLRNLEYDLTRTIKRVVFGFQSIDSVLASLDEPARLSLVVTPNTLPADFAEVPETVQTVAADIEAVANGKFSLEVVDPTQPGARFNQQVLFDEFGIQPIPVDFFSNESYYLYLILEAGPQAQVIYPSGDLTQADIRTALESGLKRASSGFLKTVGIWTPPQGGVDQFGQPQPTFSSWQNVTEQLRQEYEVRTVTLDSGQVAADIDVLLLIAPHDLSDVERYAVDQFLMRGGSLIVAGGNQQIGISNLTGDLTLEPTLDGVQDLLTHYGVTVQDGVVMDTQNEPFPVPVVRDLGGVQVREYQSINYPFFVDVRPATMDSGNPMLAGLTTLTLNWASPLAIDEAKNADRNVSVLFTSTDQAWLRTDPEIQPDLDQYPELGFPIEGEQQQFDLGVAIQGQFESYFVDKENPLTVAPEGEDPAAQTNPALSALNTIERSPESARLVVVGSADFLNDAIFEITLGNNRGSYLSQLQFVQNSVDWAVEDLDLLSIRARGSHVRVLNPLTEAEQTFWEGINYALALASVVIIGLIWGIRRSNEKPIIDLDNQEPSVKEVNLEQV